VIVSDEPIATDRQGLFEFLASKRATLIEIWMQRVRNDERISSSDDLSKFVLLDHMPDILMQIILAIGRHKSGIISKEEASRLAGSSEASKAHADLRFLNGYTLNEAMLELGHLRGAIIELWHEERVRPSDIEVEVLHACIDDVMATAAREMGHRMAAAKDVFLAKLSHEMSGPMTVLTAHIHSILKLNLNDSPLSSSIATMDRHLEILVSVVNNLKSVSAIVFGRLRLETRPCNIESLMTAAYETIEEAAKKKNLEVDLHTTPSAEPFLADTPKLLQALSNLLSNSVKFTPDGGKIGLTAQQTDSRIEFTVSDNGVGMATEFLPLAFEQFRQESEHSNKGLGLGLAIARELVELHQGRIFCTSSGRDQGSMFKISIPFRKVLGDRPEHYSH
jgi:signal transduction histidine kinase